MKRIIAVLLAVSLTLSLLCVSAYATAGTDGEFTATASKETIKAGDTFDVTIALKRTTSTVVGALDFKVALSSGLEYVSHKLGDLDAYSLKSYTPANGVFTATMTATGVTKDITVLTLTIKAKDTNCGPNKVTFSDFSVGNSDGTGTLNYGSLDEVVVTTYTAITGNLSVTIAKPVVNQAPVTTLTDTRYSGTITWDPAVASGGNFAASIAYTANVTLTAKDGYQFANDVEPAVTDATISDKSVSADGKTLTFNAKFPVTGSLPAARVTAAPTAKSGLEYKGTEQDLLGFMGTADGGTMQYSLDNSSWSAAIPMGKNAGDYTVYYMVKGDSSHSDYTPSDNTVSVKIESKSISTATIGTIADQSYTGGAITPDLVVTDGTTPLAKDTDYTVSCADIYVGSANLTITGKGNYTGTKGATFTIVAAEQTPTFTTPVDLAKGGHMLDLRDFVSGAKGNVTFTIASGTAATLSGHTLTSTGITGAVTIKVSITANDVNGDSTPEYNAYTGTNAITVNVVDKTSDTTTMKVSQDDITYGETVSPSVTDKPASTGTVSYTYEGRDGTTYNSVTAPKNVGKYKVTAKCESSTVIYTAEDTFEILHKSISGMTVTLDKTSLEYNGGAQTVTVTVTDGASTLTKDTDYTVTGATSGTDVNSYTVTVTGQGNYKDTATATWKITPATLTVTPVASQSKKFKEADPALTYNCSGNVSGQIPAFNGKLDREAGQNAGMYAIELGDLALKDNGAFKASNYTLEMVSPAVKFEIKKADAQALADIPVSQKYTVTAEQSKDIGRAGMPTDAGALTYSVGPAIKTGSVSVTSSMTGSTVKFTITGGANGEVITLPVTITSDNYADSIVNVKITLTKPSYFGGGGGGSSTPSYSITVDKTENGTITVSPKSASKGDTVTITVKPDKGYELEMLKALDKDGDALKLTEKNGKYTFKMPSGKVTVKGSFVEEAPVQIFKDVPTDAYYYEAVKWAAEKGITGGVGNGLFAPNQPCTRAQIVTFLWRAAGSPAPKNMSSFTDVPADAFYAKAVAWAVENGITGGTGDGKFSPDATCTRAQSVTFLYRAAGSPKVSGSAEFGDVATNAYYADAVAWAAKNGITGGIGGGLFGSGNDCTRAQIVTFLYRSVK